MEEIAAGIVKAFINSGPVGLLALISILANIWLAKMLVSIQERRIAERDAVVTALKSAADGLEDVGRLTPEVAEAVRVLRDIKDMILPEARKRR